MPDWLSITIAIAVILALIAWLRGLFEAWKPLTGALVLGSLGLVAIAATLIPTPLRQLTGTIAGPCTYVNGQYSIAIRPPHDSYSVLHANFESVSFTFPSADRFPALEEAGSTDVFHILYMPGSFHAPQQLREITELSGPYPEFHFRPDIPATTGTAFFIRILFEVVGLAYLFLAYRKLREHFVLKRLEELEAR
ncbi:MAG TPA: hypothetical protein VGL89_02465 [Candidatus Koribacter sp.]|jgi:hypothetical protein